MDKYTNEEYIYIDENMYVNRIYGITEIHDYLEDKYGIKELALAEFELIEDQAIDIDSIEELWGNCVGDSNQCRDDFMLKNRIKINELVRALKHLNKEIQSIKEGDNE